MSQTQIYRYRILQHFSSCEDPRKHRIRHELLDIIVIVVLATLCGEEGWEDIHDWAEDRQEFLKSFLTLNSDIPCPDTIRRVIERLNPDRFLEAFLSWAKDLGERKPGQINIDGKTLRKAMDERGALHLVSAFAAENGMVIGCKDAGGKGKEIPAIKELLDTIILKEGDIVTIDAIGCQTEILPRIRRHKAEYLIGLKQNQGSLFAEVANFFQQAFKAREYAPVEVVETASALHGRLESHKIWTTEDLDWLDGREKWDGIRTLVCVERNWEAKGERKSEVRYYISSAKKTASEFGELVRRHWAIENEYHWHLDVNFKEDDCEIGARSNKILRVARTISLQILKAELTKGMSIARKKRRCGRSLDYLKQVLLVGNF